MHESVLLNECILSLNLKEDGIYVDATLGYAGHSSEILKRIKKGFLFAFDQDQEAVDYSEKKLSDISSNYQIIRSNFVDLKKRLSSHNINYVDGFLFDLGISSPQIDNKERGFSYLHDALLDMRMDQSQVLSAYDVVNDYSYDKLISIFYKYGEEKYSSRIANNIIKERENKKIKTTLELVEIIKKSIPMKDTFDKSFPKRIFQAIRIEVNKELEVLSIALEDAIEMLNMGGRISVITFHSLEDRIVKNIFNKYTKMDVKLKSLPFIPSELMPKYKEMNKILPSSNELEKNRRSRSAKLRVIERIR